MLNPIFFWLIVAGVVVAAFTGNMQAVNDAAISSAKDAVELALGLVGPMALWLGVMKVLEDGGFLVRLNRLVAPVMRRLFPSIPADHPALGAMVLNIAANVMGLGNAATPFGLKAMIELDKLNRHPGVATNAMVLFLAINTAGVAVLPTLTISLRAAQGSRSPTDILFPSLLATFITTSVAVVITKLLERTRFFSVERQLSGDETGRPVESRAGAVSPDLGDRNDPAMRREVAGAPSAAGVVKGLEDAEQKLIAPAPFARIPSMIALGLGAALVFGLGREVVRLTSADGVLAALRTVSAGWILPLILVGILAVGFAQRVKVYDSVVSGAKEGFGVAITVIPYLVAILVAVRVFRASGAMDAIIGNPLVQGVAGVFGVPPAVLPMGLMRPLSGAGAQSILVDIMKTYGPDSLEGFTAAIMNGSTETTFYVLALYFGVVRVRTTRHALPACLFADVVGLYMAVHLARLFFIPG